MSEVSLDALTEDLAAVKLVPDDTGLRRAVWITENQGYRHDIGGDCRRFTVRAAFRLKRRERHPKLGKDKSKII